MQTTHFTATTSMASIVRFPVTVPYHYHNSKQYKKQYTRKHYKREKFEYSTSLKSYTSSSESGDFLMKKSQSKRLIL